MRPRRPRRRRTVLARQAATGHPRSALKPAALTATLITRRALLCPYSRYAPAHSSSPNEHACDASVGVAVDRGSPTVSDAVRRYGPGRGFVCGAIGEPSESAPTIVSGLKPGNDPCRRFPRCRPDPTGCPDRATPRGYPGSLNWQILRISLA